MLCSSFRLESQFEMSPSHQKVSMYTIHWKTNCDPIHGDSSFKILILNQSSSFEHIPVFFSPKEKSRWSHTQWHLSGCHGVGYCFQGHPRRRSDPTNDSKTWRLPKSAEAPKSNTNTQSFMAFQPSRTKWTPNGQLLRRKKLKTYWIYIHYIHTNQHFLCLTSNKFLEKNPRWSTADKTSALSFPFSAPCARKTSTSSMEYLRWNLNSRRRLVSSRQGCESRNMACQPEECRPSVAV